MKSDSYPKLHPELVPYLAPMRGFGQLLKHPLVFSVPYFGEQENERLNKLFEFRKNSLKEAMASGNHQSYVFTHERPYRLDALLELKGEIPEKALLPLILEVYVDSENISENSDEWLTLLEDLTGTDPWNTVSELPNGPFTIYRGGSRNGFSWTMDLEKAKWFARRWQQDFPVWEATVTRNDVIGYYDGRGEKEVIVNPDDISHLVDLYHETL